jgi:hypothetical protein
MRTEVDKRYNAMGEAMAAEGKITIDLRDVYSMAAAVRHGITTPDLLHDQLLGTAEMHDGCLVPDPGRWTADDGNAPITIEADGAEEACEEYVSTGDWGDRSSTSWVSVSAWQTGIDADGDVVQVNQEHHSITIEAEEPTCDHADGHDWQSPHAIVGGLQENPGVWGHGGGVLIYQCCMRCGCGRVTDTWAQNPANGEQGLRSVEYTPGEYADKLASLTQDD